MLSLFLWGVASCSSGSKEEQQYKAKAKQEIARAEQLLKSNPGGAMTVLNNIPEVDSLDNELLVRWCMASGEAANELRKNELLSLPHLVRAFGYCSEHGALAEKGRIAFYLGNAYLEYKDGVKATELYLEALRLADLNKNYKLAGDVGNAIGRLYTEKEMDVQAQEKYEAAVEYYRLDNNLLGQVRALGNVAYALVYRGMLDDALVRAKEADRLATAGGDRFSMGIAAGVLAWVYGQMGDYALAENNALKGIEFDTVNTAPHYVALADIYMRQQKFAQARECLQKAKTANSLNKHTPIRIALYLSQIDEAEGQLAMAQAHFKHYTVLRDSLLVPTKAYQLLAAERSNEELKGQMLIASKQAKTQHTAMVIGGALLLVVVVLGFLCNPYIRKYLLQRDIYKTLRELEVKRDILRDLDRTLELECEEKAEKVLFLDD